MDPFGYIRVANINNINTHGQQFCSIYLSMIGMQELNAPLANLLMILKWKVLLTLLRDKRPYRTIG